MPDLVFPGIPTNNVIGQDRLPSSVDLVIWQGDYFDFRLTVNNENGTPVNLAGQTPSAKIRATYGSDEVYPFTTTIVGTGATGEVDLYLPSSVTSTLTAGSYIWDFQLTINSGPRAGDTRTYLAGDVLVYPEVNP